MSYLITLSRANTKLKILDAGCGSGIATKQLASWVPNKNSVIYAYDLSENMISYAKKEFEEFDDFNSNPNNHWEFKKYENKINIDKDIEELRKSKTGKIVNLLLGNSQDLQIEDEQFDAYIANLMFQEIPEPDLALKEAFRVLKKGGVCAFSIWGKKEDTKYKRFFEENFKKFGIPDTSNRDGPFKLGENPELLKEKINNAGFTNIKMTYTNLIYDIYSVEEFFDLFKNDWINKVIKEQLEQGNEEKINQYLNSVREDIKKELVESGNLPNLNILIVVAFKP